LTALGPLLLAERGLGAGAIAACFVCAAAPQLLFTPALGRRLARSGLVEFCIAMFLLSALLLPLTTVPTGQLTTAAVFSVVVGGEFITFNPLLLLTSSTAERLERSQGLAMSMANGAWGLGAAAGGLCVARVADATSIAGGFVAAGFIAFTAGVVLATALRRGVGLK
jgi:predicted MFS family arabinose efflux permease